MILDLLAGNSSHMNMCELKYSMKSKFVVCLFIYL